MEYLEPLNIYTENSNDIGVGIIIGVVAGVVVGIVLSLIKEVIKIPIRLWNRFWRWRSLRFNPQPIFSAERLERIIQLERLDAVEEFKKATDAEKIDLFKKISEYDNRLANLPQAFEEAQAQIANLKVTLENEGHEIGEEKLADAVTALENGDFSKADKLFEEIEIREQLVVQRAGRAAFARGELAEQEVRWHDAYEHYTRAAQLDPCFNTLIRAQKLAYEMDDYPNSIHFNMKLKENAIAVYGEESEQYAQAINDLAAIYTQHEEYELAEPLHKEALKLRQDILGKNHIDTAESLNNLATLYDLQERHEEAVVIFKEALNIQQETLGIDHPITTLSMSNLATTYCSQGKYKEAEELFKKVLDINQKTFRGNHPNTANSFNNLGYVYFCQNQYKKAEPFCRQALEIFEAILGPDHPKTKSTRANYEEIKKHLP